MTPGTADAVPAGVLPVDKPEGPTSHDIVAAARRALGERRIGHTGTLDPFASGLLLLCVGWATRLAEYLTAWPKRYEAVAELGVRTDTDDRTGAPVQRSEAWRALDEQRIRAAFEEQRGRRLQRPPDFSAKKVAGERLYRRARRGLSTEVAAVPVEIYSLDVDAVDPPRVAFRLECSSGTYVRAIARDAGEALGTGAHLVSLRRTAVGDFDVADAVSVDRLTDPAAVAAAWIRPLDAVAHLPRVTLTAAEVDRLRHGRAVRPAATPQEPAPGPVAVCLEDALVAVAEWHGEALRPRKVFDHA